MNTSKAKFRTLLASCLLSMAALPLAASPIISVDLDPSTPGIQSTLSVTTGATFTVEVLIADDGLVVSPATFDTLLIESFYNHAGAVLGAGPIGATWLPTLAINSPFTFDFFTLLAPSLIPGGAGVFGPTVAAGFGAGSGAIGLVELMSLFSISPGLPTAIFSLDFTALMAGTSDVLASGSPFGIGATAFMGAPLPETLLLGTVTVTDPTRIPEPTIFSLLLLGVAGISLTRTRKQT